MDSVSSSSFRAGLAVLIGRTNAGKSSLMNALVDAPISIVSPRPQTTRHSIHGVVHRPEGQIVFVDTPGLFKTHKSALVDRLHSRARAALEGINVVIHVVDPTRAAGAEEEMVGALLATIEQPRILCLTKADLRRRPHRDEWLARGEGYAAVVEVSALTRRHLDTLIDAVLPLMPLSPPLYPPGEFTNASREFRIGEIIREKVYQLTDEEVPYRTAVRVDEDTSRTTEAGNEVIAISATVLVSQERYKAMLIGAGGRKINEIRSAAAKDLRRLRNKRVVLKLQVAVDATAADGSP